MGYNYTAFGLKIAGISSRKLQDPNEGHVDNKNLYNDKELWDDGDLNWYDYGFRNYDPQIGRFPQLDPLTDDYPHYTPYQYAGNEPIANVDMDGLEEFNALKVLQDVNVISKGTAKAAAKTLSNLTPLAMAAINISANIVSNQIDKKTTNQTLSNKNVRTQVDKAISDYFDSHTEMSITDKIALDVLTRNYFDGLNLMGWWSKGDFMKLNRAVINSTLPDPLKIQLVQLGIQDIQEGVAGIMGEGANVGLFISGAALFPNVGLGPKGSMLKFRMPPIIPKGTGRIVAGNLEEKLAMQEIQSNPSLGSMIKRLPPLKDPRWFGWRKMQYIKVLNNGKKINIHYNGKFEDGILKAVDDFKFK